MSKTTVTQLVQQLEARLRVKLLNRTTRRVNVTADGAAYHVLHGANPAPSRWWRGAGPSPDIPTAARGSFAAQFCALSCARP